ncbi:hypothetical protein BD809_103155 [Aquimarina intermedia]|uniref:Uncharacterized protein n=1 Tax=Aquimarina intermedia TaxID=350814 RepID=A0A5S5C9C1_9FLAO|nr:hypothetical protein BD809_103155 [Aquimarina intermedia]
MPTVFDTFIDVSRDTTGKLKVLVPSLRANDFNTSQAQMDLRVR